MDDKIDWHQQRPAAFAADAALAVLVPRLHTPGNAKQAVYKAVSWQGEKEGTPFKFCYERITINTPAGKTLYKVVPFGGRRTRAFIFWVNSTEFASLARLLVRRRRKQLQGRRRWWPPRLRGRH